MMTVLAGASVMSATVPRAADGAGEGYLAVGVGLQGVDTASRERALYGDPVPDMPVAQPQVGAGPIGPGSPLETSSVERSSDGALSPFPVPIAAQKQVVIEQVPATKPSAVTVKKTRAAKSVARRTARQARTPDKETATKLIARGMDTGLNISHIEAPGED